MKAMYADQFQALINDVKRKKGNDNHGKHTRAPILRICF